MVTCFTSNRKLKQILSVDFTLQKVVSFSFISPSQFFCEGYSTMLVIFKYSVHIFLGPFHAFHRWTTKCFGQRLIFPAIAAVFVCFVFEIPVSFLERIYGKYFFRTGSMWHVFVPPSCLKDTWLGIDTTLEKVYSLHNFGCIASALFCLLDLLALVRLPCVRL